MQKILIIEDDKIKIEKLSNFFEGYNYTIKESYHSGLKELIDGFGNYSFLILDMTIPLWDKGNNNLGGNYEQFGGERILREIKRRKKEIPTILVSMFDVFPTPEGNLTFEELNSHLKSQFPSFYVGGVFYNAIEADKWKTELRNLINSIRNRLND
jgi:CheY-like chemotaxis protein